MGRLAISPLSVRVDKMAVSMPAISLAISLSVLRVIVPLPDLFSTTSNFWLEHEFLSKRRRSRCVSSCDSPEGTLVATIEVQPDENERSVLWLRLAEQNCGVAPLNAHPPGRGAG